MTTAPAIGALPERSWLMEVSVTTSSCQAQRPYIALGSAGYHTPTLMLACRDRADERRKGVNPDYDGGLSDLSAHPGSMQVRQAACQ